MEPIFYRKNKNIAFPYLEKELDVSNLQNYIPIYDLFFTLNENNRNSINLNNKWEITSITQKISDKIYEAFVEDEKGNKKKVNVFFKFAPLIDPLKYLIGKYKDDDINILPCGDKDCDKKMLDVNNAAYVDSFFSYLTSKLLNEYGFVHGLDYHGGFLGVKNDYIFNSEDDIDYMLNSSFFNENKNSLFKVTDELKKLINNDSVKNKIKLNIKKDEETINLSSLMNITGLDDDNDNDNDNGLKSGAQVNDISLVDISTKQSRSTHSSCSSRSSVTDDEEDNDGSDGGSDGGDGSSDGSSDGSDGDDENFDIKINEFPVNIIALEACETTLDKLIEEDISYAELISAFMQIIMTLATYQKVFNFTHNDLHTNNVMFVETDKQNIFYHFEGVYYKVPTYGKLFKIIDFGRAIYKYNGNLHCSDSFSLSGDAATQYNFEPYFNDKKPRLEPNYSFDLCRLACSLYDNLIDEDEDDKNSEVYNPIKILMEKWCKDDKGRNILYKKNGEERYPEFKLYKMIARSVHNITPKAQLEDTIFSKYSVSKKSIKKNTKVVDIDAIPCMV
tara:strand:+ start:1526 stop:3205 length:1680 start_codon:yes stop_codon:yes gene_type:complete